MRELIHQIPNQPREGPGAEPKNLFILAPDPLEYSLALPGGSSLPTHSLQMVIPSHTAQASPLLPSSLPPIQTDILHQAERTVVKPSPSPKLPR